MAVARPPSPRESMPREELPVLTMLLQPSVELHVGQGQLQGSIKDFLKWGGGLKPDLGGGGLMFCQIPIKYT